ncbi:uracil-DNA glycosylase [Crocinitomix algicola]|uniref:uracil-DNA glycosylase n=1 Tax=Crocinitomix algicola TaxID=1740263 RepID=UPI000835C984|nr:uracil-DNA glycosylase [Crocinitomix algicola]
MIKFTDKGWEDVLRKQLASAEYKKLIENLSIAYSQNSILPKKEQVFRAFNLCSFKQTKIVILGQDPYPTKGHANGLAFSVAPHVSPLPKSLINIFKELNQDIPTKNRTAGDLSDWAKQGVLLLNTVLTVKEGEANAHANIGWQLFTDEVIKTISSNLDGIIFILWGKQAQNKTKLIDENKHHILKSPHPSPLSAYRGFFNSKPFSKSNELLALQGKAPINW